MAALGRTKAVEIAREAFTSPPLVGYGTFNAWKNAAGVAQCVRMAVEVRLRLDRLWAAGRISFCFPQRRWQAVVPAEVSRLITHTRPQHQLRARSLAHPGSRFASNLQAGVRHIDCASFYDNEGEIGSVFAAMFSEGVITREELFIVGKLPQGAHHREAVMPQLQASLRDLQVGEILCASWRSARKKCRCAFHR